MHVIYTTMIKQKWHDTHTQIHIYVQTHTLTLAHKSHTYTLMTLYTCLIITLHINDIHISVVQQICTIISDD